MAIRISSEPTRVSRGVYRVLCDCVATRFHGHGDGARAIESLNLRAGSTLVVSSIGKNGFWWGVELATLDPTVERMALEQYADGDELDASQGDDFQDNSRINAVRREIATASATL